MSTVVLAYSGGFQSSLAVHWLADTLGVEVVTVTLDVGQGEGLSALRARALSCGAVRAHAIDAREKLTREYLLPSVQEDAFGSGCHPRIDELTRPLIANTLVEVARIEGVRSVAHGSGDPSFDDCIRAVDSSIDIVAPAREWQMEAAQLAEYARARGVASRHPIDVYCRIDQNLWGRTVSWRDGDPVPDEARSRVVTAAAEPSQIEIAFERSTPISVNGVMMSPVELVESLTLIAGRHSVGRLEACLDGRRVVYDAPAAVVLHAAHAAAGERAGVVRLVLANGEYAVLAGADPDPSLVNHA